MRLRNESARHEVALFFEYGHQCGEFPHVTRVPSSECMDVPLKSSLRATDAYSQ
jgi:hypothetical protein